MPWIHGDDLVGVYLRALGDGSWSGAYNACAPEPVTNGELSKALGRVLRRPAVLPVPALALRALYGGMAEIVTTGQRAVPERALAAGYAFRHTDVEAALRDALRPGR
jgi:NAD dependent epimerase/dehydratase family enzyme